MEAHLAKLDTDALRREFVRQGAFLSLSDFLAPQVTEQLVRAVAAVEPVVNRNYLPGHKQGGSVSRHTLDERAPFIAELRHRISLLGENEKRVSLTFEYVTDQRMHPGWRLISNFKDAVAYFGLRQVFRRKGPGAS